MPKISLATVARALDAMLDGQMTAQARIAAHLVAVSEASGHDASQVIETLEAISSTTVLDEFWITDEQGVAYLTNVRDATGALMPFRFNPNPAVQPQASKFYALLASPIESDHVITQSAQVREIDQEIYKYVGVNGVDRKRIVQVGNALAFEEHDLQSGSYTSPVMTAVMAAFGEPDLLDFAFTDQLDEIRVVFEEILGKQIIVQARLVEHFVTGAEEAGWPMEEINGRLMRIVNSSPLDEIHVVSMPGDTVYSSLRSPLAGETPAGLPGAGELSSLLAGTNKVADQPTAPRASDGALYKYVTVAFANTPRFVHLSLPIDDGTLLSPRYNPASTGG